MQDPSTGQLFPLESLDDPKRKGKEDWPTYSVGEHVRFRGWWWRIERITGDGLHVRPANKATKAIETVNRDLSVGPSSNPHVFACGGAHGTIHYPVGQEDIDAGAMVGINSAGYAVPFNTAGISAVHYPAVPERHWLAHPNHFRNRAVTIAGGESSRLTIACEGD